jgi:tetratricopeptide (TPR) repeat protein
MRIFVALGLVLLTGTSMPPARADDAAPNGLSSKNTLAETHEQRLDRLFTELKRERNEQVATHISQRIWQEWSQSGSASVDLMMQWTQKAIESKKFDIALDFLDQVVILEPTYAEGWNRRATVHYMMKNYGKSMADIDRTLQLEPRHFGALSGLAQIMLDTGRKEAALRAWQRVLDIYPMLRNAQDQVSTISEELAGESI